MNRRHFFATSLTSSLAFLAAHESLTSRNSPAQNRYAYRQEYEPWTSDDVFLQGINAPVFHEIDVNQLAVTGNLPPDLTGIYLRNGPNPMFVPIAYQFPLVGDGMLHAVYFENGAVRYRNRWIKTRGLTYEMSAGRALQELQMRNYANTSIVAHGGKLLALYESGLPYQLTPALETVGEWDFQGGIQKSMSAHPRHDPTTGELHFHRYSLFTEPYLTYYVANAEGKVVYELPITLPQPTLIHDLALTQHYAIAFHCPFEFDFQQASQQGNPFVWRAEQPTRIGLIPRPGTPLEDSQQPLWLETEPFWSWHFVNAYETGEQVVIDCVAYPEMQLTNTLDSLLSQRSHLHRITVDRTTQKVTQSPLDDRAIELPTVDARQVGKPYRFAYMVKHDPELVAQKGIPNYFPALIQYDVVNQRRKVHRFPSGCYAGEAMVVPKPGEPSEQNCYVLTWVFDENRQASDLVILDAAHFDQEAIAQIHLPVRVPLGFHGTWVPLSALSV